MKVKKIGVLFLWIMLTVACISKNTNKAILKNEEQKVTTVDTLLIDSESPQLQLQLSGLETYIQSTSFSAVINNIQIQTTKEDNEDRHTIKAAVVELFRGEANQFIEFDMYTESGELVSFEEEVFICLCQDEEQLFWAGTGSVFPVTEVFMNKATETVKNFKGSTESFCEE